MVKTETPIQEIEVRVPNRDPKEIEGYRIGPPPEYIYIYIYIYVAVLETYPSLTLKIGDFVNNDGSEQKLPLLTGNKDYV